MRHEKTDYETVSKHPVIYYCEDGMGYRVIDCDFDKRVVIQSLKTGEKKTVKWGYCFKSIEEVKQFIDYGTGESEDLPHNINPFRDLLNKKNYSSWKKYKLRDKKRRECCYSIVPISNPHAGVRDFKTLSDCLKAFAALPDNGYEIYNYRLGTLLESEKESGDIVMYNQRNGGQRIKNRHLRKYRII